MIVFNFGPLSKDELTIRFDLIGARDFMTAVLEVADGASNERAIDCFKFFKNSTNLAKIIIKKAPRMSFRKKKEGFCFVCRAMLWNTQSSCLKNFFQAGILVRQSFGGFQEKKEDTRLKFIF